MSARRYPRDRKPPGTLPQVGLGLMSGPSPQRAKVSGCADSSHSSDDGQPSQVDPMYGPAAVRK
jgi:hypothetical protein